MRTISNMSERIPTHKGKVRLVDLGDFVVAGIEVRSLLGQRWYTVQLQIITVD